MSDHVGSVPTGYNIISIFQLGQDGSNLNRDTRDSLDCACDNQFSDGDEVVGGSRDACFKALSVPEILRMYDDLIGDGSGFVRGRVSCAVHDNNDFVLDMRCAHRLSNTVYNTSNDGLFVVGWDDDGNRCHRSR